MYFNCQKTKAFELFEDGMRPAEAFNMLSLKKRTVYRYFQDWKRRNRIKRQAAELNRLRNNIRKRTEDVDKWIAYIRRHSENNSPRELAKWQKQKRRAEELLKTPFSATPVERKMLEDYSD